MPRKVVVRVTKEIIGAGTLRPYPDKQEGVLYEVPLYRVVVAGTDAKKNAITRDFKAYRFGIQLDAQRQVTSPRVVGLADAQSHVLNWSYITTVKEMAWRVYAGFFIHRGPDDPATSTYGSIGCIEISGKGQWDLFNKTIIEFAGASSAEQVSTAKTIRADYDAAPRPALKRKIKKR